MTHARVPVRGQAHLHAHPTGQGNVIHAEVRRESMKATGESRGLDPRECQRH